MSSEKLCISEREERLRLDYDTQLTNLNEKIKVLKVNISTLYKTANAVIARKDEEIAELKLKVESLRASRDE